MAPRNPQTHLATHDVTNQPPPLEDTNVFEATPALKDAVVKFGGAAHVRALSEFGAAAGSAEAIEWGRLAQKNPPQLVSFDRYGQRLDEVEYHPAYHSLMEMGLKAGVAAGAWRAKEAGHVLHAGLMFLMGQADGGPCCPMSMTYAAVPALRAEPEVAKEWEPRATALDYDRRFIPATEKRAATLGMAMTEKQGGSDVRANTTRATPIGGGAYELSGHKWFCSAPMCDAFLTLAQTDAGVTCFLVQRWRPDGTRNAFHIMRLKDKLGDRSNASSEIEYHGAYAVRVGEEGRGVRTIIDMVQHTRLDCIVGSAGNMRAGLAQALWHAGRRTAFQKKLIDQPAMTMVLADLALEAEAAIAIGFRVARAFDKAPTDDFERAFARLATPLAKYWTCKRAPGAAFEALECLGGAGFIEEGPMPRIYRAAPLNSIWEGSGNVIALDILRALAREPESLAAVRAEIAAAAGGNAHFARHAARLEQWFEPGRLSEASARAFAEDMALALQAAALRVSAPDYVFDAFCAARLDSEERSLAYGAVTAKIDAGRIVARAMAA